LLNSGIGLLSADYAWQVTAEGDYILMLLQAARFLLKSFHIAKRGEKLSGLMECLEPLKDPRFVPARDARPRPATTAAEVRDIKHLLAMFRYRVLVAVERVGTQFDARLKRPGTTFEDAFNSCALNLQMTAVSFAHYFMLRNFVDVLNQQEDPHISRALGRLVSLFALSEMLDGKQWTGLVDAVEASSVDTAVVDLLDELRPDVVALVDAFDFPDSVLNSTIGSYDGNVYERLFDAAFHAPLNAHPDKPFKGYEELRKSLDLDFLRLRNMPGDELRDDDARAKL
jgi:acyl-CoA oxidase